MSPPPCSVGLLSVTMLAMLDGWDFYFCKINDAQASIYLDLGLHDSAPDPRRPWRLWTWVELLDVGHSGLGSRDEAQQLYDIEDRLVAAAHRLDATYAGRIRRTGRWEFYFYGRSPAGFAPAISKLMEGFPEYRYRCDKAEDPGWLFYRNMLYPASADLQQIINRRAIDALRDKGDDLVAARPVRHWLAFASEADLQRFAEQAKADRFTITKQCQRDTCDDGRPFGLQIERQDYVDQHSIDAVVTDLVHKAESFDGAYGGWQTEVVKGK